ncbi:MAG: hypothetical protein QHH14_11275 [Clostridiales bacterium]|jgi:hypothetical protein|nr:hypothetical protein [Clostridiales bacterium]
MKEIRVYYETRLGVPGIVDCRVEQLASALRIIRHLDCRLKSVWRGLIQLYPIEGLNRGGK